VEGLFITFEGIDGCGKSTQLEMLVRSLVARGLDPVYTREPGGTAIGERMRPLLLSSSEIKLYPMTELLLLAAARAQHVAEVILPGLESGRTVLSDRYVDSTVAFQGYGRGLDLNTIDELNLIATGSLLPHLTILFDVEVAVARGRLDARPSTSMPVTGPREPVRDRFENEDFEFHSRVRQGYLEIARLHPGRISVIDTSGTPEKIHSRVLDLVLPLIAPAARAR
jgi:dTMP kinase